ncbi:hypothetical protein Tco_1546640 [Tanacetum coccineum]
MIVASLMYLTSSRPDLIYVVCLCSRYQANPTEKHLNAVKWMFQYLKGTINMGLWYSKDIGMSLIAYADADRARCQDTRRSTSGSALFLSDKLVENGIVELYFVRTEYQLADIFIKPLPRERFNFLIEKLAKLDLELVPKEKRLEIRKCNRRLNPGKIQREPTFQVVLEALALTPCYSAFLITADVTEGRDFDALPTDEEFMSFLRDLVYTREISSLNDVVVDQMHQPWRTFAALINRILSGKTTGLDNLRLSKAQIFWGMYHQKNVDYVELLWEDFIYQIDNRSYKKKEKVYYPRFTKVIIHYFLTQDKADSWRNKIRMHTSKDDYLINTLRFVSAKEATQIYSAILPESLTSPEMKEIKAYKTYLVSPEEPMRNSKRVKRPVKKSTKAPTRGVVIRETPKMPLSKKKEKMTLEKHKGIDLLSEVALTEEAQYEEARQKRVADVTEEESSESEAESWGNDEDDSNNDHDSIGEDSDQENDSDDDKTQSDNENESDSEHETDKSESSSKSDQEENEEDIGDDKEEVKDEFVKTPSNNSDDEDKAKITDKAEGDEDEEMDYTTIQLYDDVDIRMNELVDTDKGFIQEEGTDAKMTNVQQRNENPEIFQVIEDAHVTLSIVPQKTEIPVISSSHSSDLAFKFLNFLDIPHTNAEIVSPIDVHVHHEVPSQQTPILLTVHVSVITDSSLILPKEVSNFAPPMIQSMVTESLEQAILAKESSQPKSTFEAASLLTEFELTKILIDKMDKTESYLAAPEHRECYEGLIKSYDLYKTLFSTYDKVYSLKRSRKDKDKDEDPFR